MGRGVMGAGNWIVDTIKTIDRWPGEGNLCNIQRQEMAPGGGACNLLFDLAVMDSALPLTAIGKLGSDREGDFLLSEIGKRGISSSGMEQTDLAPTSYTDVMSGGGRRTFFHCRGANALLGGEDILGSEVEAKIFYLGYLLLLDRLDEGDPEYGTVGARVLHAMRERGMKTVVDFVSEAPEKFQRVVRAALPHIDVLVVNEVEAGSTFNLPIRREGDSLDFEAMDRCSELFIGNGVKEAVVIHFPEGVYCRTAQGNKLHLPSFPIAPGEIVGSVGAGDAFCAGVVYGLHEDYPLEQTLKLANASAYANLKSAGSSTGALPLAELRRIISRFC